MAYSITQHYALTFNVPDDMAIYEGQERVLQNFPEQIAGIEITYVEIVAGLHDKDDVPIGERA